VSGARCYAAGLSKGVGFVRFDRRDEAERAIQQLNGIVPAMAGDQGSGPGHTGSLLLEPISVKFANSPSSSPLGSAAYAARHGLLGGRGVGPAAAAAGAGPGGLSTAAALAAAAYLSPNCRNRLVPSAPHLQHSANRCFLF